MAVKHAPILCEMVANSVEISGKRSVNPMLLAQRITEVFVIEAHSLPQERQLTLLAELMMKIGVGTLPLKTDWAFQLRHLCEVQLSEPFRLGWSAPILRWAISVELSGEAVSLAERSAVFRQILASAPRAKDVFNDNVAAFDLNRWAYLLLRLELFKSATPIAEAALALATVPDIFCWANDTYGWALFYEGDLLGAKRHLDSSLSYCRPGSDGWCEVQYHRFQCELWSKQFSSARDILSAMTRENTGAHWTRKALEMEPLIAAPITPKPRVGRRRYTYDIVLSFAGEDRGYADSLARSLVQLGYKVFYDDFERAALWGQDLYRKLTTIYEKQGKYCAMFVSASYVRKRWTNLESRAAQARAFRTRREYILPIRIDDSELPGLPPTVGYMSWAGDGLPRILQALTDKLGKPQ